MRRLSVTGVVVASASWVFAWLPSLLPSGTVLHGVALGLSAAVGYALGVAIAAVGRGFRRNRRTTPQPPERNRIGVAVAVVAALLALASGIWLSGGLATQAESMGAPEYSVAWAIASGIGLAVFAVLLLSARGVRHVTNRFARSLPRSWPVVATRGLSATVTLALMALLVTLSLVGLRSVFDRIDASAADQSAPSSPTRSGSSASLIPFDTLGRQGRDFVTQGAQPDSIRTYAGLESAADPKSRAELAVADMLRAGGAQAPIWVGITTTGNGFVDPVATDAADAATQGQAALVAMQYSTLPSWLSFLVDQGGAKEAGTELYRALATARDQLPADQRPRLILYGESLGAFGSAAPFIDMSVEEIAQRIDGALWVGPPAATQPVSDWTYSGAPPVWEPVIDDGRQVRYAATTSAVESPPGEGPWLVPRILVLQNATDPVVWFSPSLVWRPAQWLADPRGPGVQSGTRWLPLLLFVQVALDLPQAVGMPSGYGHDYTDALLPAWRQVLNEQG